MWYYNNQPIVTIEELPNWESLLGFAYKITCIQPGPNFMKFYIGRKSFVSTVKKKLTKKELPTDKRLKTFTHVTKQSDWQKYYGSNVALKADVKSMGAEMFSREIIGLAYNKKELTFIEMEHQFNHNVLRVGNCYNDNIIGRFFRKDLI